MSMRKIHIQDQVWQYMIGKKNAVIWDTSNKKFVVLLSDITGRTQQEIDQGRQNYKHPTFNKDRKEAFVENLERYERKLEIIRDLQLHGKKSKHAERYMSWKSICNEILEKPRLHDITKDDLYGKKDRKVRQGMVLPSDIKAYIETKILGYLTPSCEPKPLCCSCLTQHKVYFRPWPYASEIEDDHTCYDICNRCADENAMDI